MYVKPHAIPNAQPQSIHTPAIPVPIRMLNPYINPRAPPHARPGKRSMPRPHDKPRSPP